MDYKHSDSLTHLMKSVLKLHRHNVDRLIQEYDVYPGQPPLLLRLAEQDGQIQKELAQKINIQPATLTVMITRMEKAGLLERRTDPEDQRVSRVYLTEKGRMATGKVKEALRTIEEACFGNFSLEEKLLFRRLLLQMQSDLQALPPQKNG
ncbi:MarR family transcriptional regulator [Paenibacillus doosanensis]|uniref:Transcriptional regulator HosA n=1 Tax=Paenibacillus konkukensis TaxID=2020716 RepID=A0ABY4RM38_9BACL|nr:MULTISPECIES: MarR family transcriptional regulator [Paenibacillus]MCS7464973.1 MarR family transcriptional regulator [Paenibacillus doosanensis]UQZ83529.1 Transcriptional regulator HosA [Paenibacillus konkukensis]